MIPVATVAVVMGEMVMVVVFVEIATVVMVVMSKRAAGAQDEQESGNCEG
jgi:heme/copper-type cytochrome/quinol oxidase subunit 2